MNRSPRLWIAVVSLSVAMSATAGMQHVVDERAMQPLRAAAEAGESVRIEVPLADGVRHELEIERFEVWAPDAQITLFGDHGKVLRRIAPPSTRYFRGTVDGDPESFVFLSMDGDRVGGVIVKDGRRFGLGRAGGRALVVEERTDFDDVSHGQEPYMCRGPLEAPDPNAIAPSMLSRPVRELASPNGTRVLRLAMETDFELYSAFGSNSANVSNFIGNLVGAGSVIYRRDLGTELQVGHTSIYTTAADPYSGSDASPALYELGDVFHSGAPPYSGSRSAVVLMSGKDLGGGVAWLQRVGLPEFLCGSGGCAGRWVGPYAVCGNINNQTIPNPNQNPNYTIDGAMAAHSWSMIVFTHELGHNVQSPHTHCINMSAANQSLYGRTTVDRCFGSEGGCYAGPGVLPIEPPQRGTIMSYCHQLAGGLSNLRFTFGQPTDGSGIVAENMTGQLAAVSPGIASMTVPSSMAAGTSASASVSATAAPIVGGSDTFSYTWTVTNGTINSGQGTPAINFTATANPATVRVLVINSRGVGFSDFATVSVDGGGGGNPDVCNAVQTLETGPISLQPSGGAWTRQVREGGETWTYRFTVADVGRASARQPEVGLKPDLHDQSVGYAIREQTTSAASVGALATFDIAAQRAYLRSAAAQGGVEVAQPAAGQLVYFYADVQINGTGSSFSTTLRATLNGSHFCSGTINATPGFGYATWCGGGWTATAGTHTLQWDFDYLGTVEETNESNNSASAPFTVPAAGGIDIVAQRAFLRTAGSNGGSEIVQPVTGQSVYFHGAFQVTGSGSPVTVTQRALLDGASYCSCETVATPGSTYVSSCSEDWVAQPGSHTLTWEFDYNNSVAETNESNNSTAMAINPASGDTTAPAGSIAINAGALSTTSQMVTLTLAATDATGVVAYYPSNSSAVPTAAQAGWISVTPATAFNFNLSAWLLGTGDGVKTVYVWYKDAANNVSATASDTIVLDEIPNVRADINADGRADIFWRNSASGETSIWFMNGTAFSSALRSTTLAPSWRPAAAGDFDGDSRSDLFWLNSNGSSQIWLGWNGATYATQAASLTVPVEWMPIGAGDIDGDGRSDIFWRNTSTGETSIWFMNGATFSSAIRSTTVPLSWAPLLLADFDGDARADLFWMNATTGETSLWMAWNGAAFATQVRSVTVPGVWSPAGAGDIGGDGRADILWRNSATGETSVWMMNGAATPAFVVTTTVPTSWQPAALGDYDGDGRTDAFWRNPSTGETSTWTAWNGGAFAIQVRGLTVVPTSWEPFHSR